MAAARRPFLFPAWCPPREFPHLRRAYPSAIWLYKKDHAQLLEAERWLKEAYPGRTALRVSALPEAVADAKATPVGSFALRLDEITKIVGTLRGVLIELVSTPGKPDVLRDRCETALVKAHLKPDSIKTNFLKPFGKEGQSPQSRLGAMLVAPRRHSCA
jgi:hypothetical protein